ncbi:MAG: hypothetical protein L6R40_007495 [Gallowayella cf. fulva]|nr:MAG: hypothetical protein L6R40_007495 [Xanthomendoza cf. fulva]
MQTEVGTVDVVNTWSAAQAVYGWMGGTEGLRFLLTRMPNPLGRRLRDLKLDRNLRLMPFLGHVLTSHGPPPPALAYLNDAPQSFGGDIRTQVIGTTLCALAHECELLTAARLFCRFLLPYLFGETSPAVYAVQSQLMEDTTLQKISNEGAARGLNNLFIETASKLDLPIAVQGWRQTKLGEEDRGCDFLGEVNMIGGLLKWVTCQGHGEYRTRSSCVARVAAYLREVGYNIGSIQTWSGDERMLPRSIGTKSLTLVLGGSSETDPFMEEHQQLPDTPLILHYQHRTVGAMLLTALGDAPSIGPEILQEDFESVFNYIEKSLTLEYAYDSVGRHARYHWEPPDDKPRTIAKRLASGYFSDCADFLAPCFDRIAKQTYLDSVRGESKKIMRPERKELGRYRALVASIVISIISRFAPKDFENMHHATTMDLSDSHWLSSICTVLDRNEAFNISTVVTLLAEIHAAHNHDRIEASKEHGIESSKRNVVAWRNGIYSVLPSFLLNMTIAADGFHFVCLDHFWANVKVGEDGSVRSSSTPDLQRYEIDIEQHSDSTNMSSLDRLDEPSLGPPNIMAPDCPLYLSLGTPLHHGNPAICFVAWLGGSVAGTVGIEDVMSALLLSRENRQTCPGHDNPMHFINVKASVWARDPYSKPANKDVPLFVPVSGDHCWAIFIAGQTYGQGGRVVFRCPTCAVEEYSSSSGGKDLHGPGCFIGFCS